MNSAHQTARAYIAVGSNIHPMDNVPAAAGMLRRISGVRLLASSRFWQTGPMGRTDQPDFVNGAWAISTDLDIPTLKSHLRDVEERLGRRRSADRNAPRTLDLDLVLYGTTVDPALSLPHPDLARPFVYGPVMELLTTDPQAEVIRRLVDAQLGSQAPPPAKAARPGVYLPDLTALLHDMLI
jgi:2-amino-4-hydroxy-6-hydroxymethyldihydropteridine diphosphokinase